MKPGERVTIIKVINNHLSEEDWMVIDLTLEQFSLPPTGTWENGDKFYCITQSLKRASDDILIELAAFLSGNLPKINYFKKPTFWTEDHYRLFISHVSTHGSEVVLLQTLLSFCGISAFIAHTDIEPSEEWREQIEIALNTCDGFLAYLTSDFHQSLWTDQEVGFALARGVPIFLIEKGTLPYGIMGKYQALRAGELESLQLAVEIFQRVLGHSKTGPSLRELIIRNLENTPNYDTSSKCMTFLQSVENLTETDLQRLKNAYDTNGQFNGVQYMDRRLKGLFHKHGRLDLFMKNEPI